MLLKKINKKIDRLTKYKNFYSFQRRINSQTKSQHKRISEWAIIQNKTIEENEPVEVGGLRSGLLKKYQNLYQLEENIRILVHAPTAKQSPAGYSIFSNLVESLQYIGIPCKQLNFDEDLLNQLITFAPTVLITNDSESYLKQIDWSIIKKYKINHHLLVGLTASIEAYGNSPITERLKWAKNNDIDFYYSFRALEYIQNRKDYSPFYDAGYQILTVEFGANPLLYYPINEIKKDLPFVFLGSSNMEKQSRYIDWFDPLITDFTGFINGYGWNGMNASIPLDANKYIFARAQVGINLHLEEQLEHASEINERTYVLAACGVPQLVDNAKLLSQRFSSNAFFVASNPKEYTELFNFLIHNPSAGADRAKIALREVYEKHTTFHRAEDLVFQIKDLIRMKNG